MGRWEDTFKYFSQYVFNKDNKNSLFCLAFFGYSFVRNPIWSLYYVSSQALSDKDLGV